MQMQTKVAPAACKLLVDNTLPASTDDGGLIQVRPKQLPRITNR